MSKTMFAVNHIRKISGQHTALEIDALSILSGEIAAIVGPADGGKEILFELLIGRLLPSSGTIDSTA